VFSDKGLLLKHFNESKVKLSTYMANNFFQPMVKSFGLQGAGLYFCTPKK
jgi:hypothetical protein